MEGGSLNPKDFVTFKSELDLLCDEDVDVFHRWNILENIQKTKVYNNVNLFLAAGGVEVLCYVVVSDSPNTDRLVYLEEEETSGTPFLKEPVGCIPPLGSLRVGSLSVLTELAKKDVYRRRMWSLDIVGTLCKRFTTRMSYVLKFSPSREDLTENDPKDQTILLLERTLSCLSHLILGNTDLSTRVLSLLGHDLLLITTAVNNVVLCDSMARLLDHCLLYGPDEDAVQKFLALYPQEKLHAIRPKCSIEHGRDHFDRFMINLDKYADHLSRQQSPLKEQEIIRDQRVSCGSCGTKKARMPVCKGCDKVHYCNKSCQGKAWLEHQITCS